MSVFRPFKGPVETALDAFAEKTLTMAGGVMEARDGLEYVVATDDRHTAGVAEGVLSVLPGLFGVLAMMVVLLAGRWLPVGLLPELAVFGLAAVVTVEALEQGREISVKTADDE